MLIKHILLCCVNLMYLTIPLADCSPSKNLAVSQVIFKTGSSKPCKSDDNCKNGYKCIDAKCKCPDGYFIHNNHCYKQRECVQANTPSKTKRLINANEASLNEFPFMVRLEVVYSNLTQTLRSECGGSIIHKNWILTAAHCGGEGFFDEDLQKHFSFSFARIFLGDHITYLTETSEKFMDSNSFIRHELYEDAEYDNDVGLIHLTEDIVFDPMTRYPICLPTGHLQNVDITGFPVTVTGWGTTETGDLSDILMKQDFQIVHNSECDEKFDIPITSDMVCSVKDDTAACGGDSGGPMFWISPESYYIQLGLVSWGMDGIEADCHLNWYDVNARVQHFIPWIETTIYPDFLP